MFRIRERKDLVSAPRIRWPMLEVAARAQHLSPALQDEDWAERWCFLTQDFKETIGEVLEFEVRPDDVFVVTFIKCGTTWMQETAWLLLNQLDYDGARARGVMHRSIFLEFSAMFKDLPENSIEMCRQQASPRLIKSHMPANLLPQQLWQKKSKIIYVARNVKDVVVSAYHFLVGLGYWAGGIDDFVGDFMSNEVLYAPFWQHVIDFWKLRHEPHVCFLTYEQMQRDLSAVIAKLCAFLERPQLSAKEMERILDHLSFEKMKDNKHTNLTTLLKQSLPTQVSSDFQFMRRGIVGSFKDELSAENQQRLMKWSTDILAKHGITAEDIFGKI